MDFLSNLIKRQSSSITLTDNETETQNQPCVSAATAIVSNGGTGTSSSSKPIYTSTSQITLAMNRSNIDTDLDNLLDSAKQDINDLKKQHNQIIESAAEPVDVDGVAAEQLIKPNYTEETISQLLNDMNVNLDQVSAFEMEHLQAMSLELSPLAVRSSPRHSMEQQKALIAAMRSPSQQPPATPTTPNNSDGLKLTGLPEFDETQIPELAPLSADMDAQLKPNALNSTTVIKQEQDYNSDSDVYAECLSLNSGKFSADHSELDAYSSALNVLDHHQLSSATATTLENTLSEATASVHNDSCEPMDVDDINETMELLKDVLAPEDCKLLQQTCLGGAIKQSFNVKENEKAIENDKKEEQVKEQELEAVSANGSLPNLSIELAPQVEEEKEEQSMPQITTAISSPLPDEPQAAASPERPTTPTMFPQSPPIPTHRTKTTEELEALKMLAAYAEPTLTQEEEEEEEQPCDNEGVPIASVEPIPTAPHRATFGVSLEEASDHQRRTFNMVDTETGNEKRRATFGVSLEEASDHQRRTFNMADTVSLAEASDHQRRTFNMLDAEQASRRTLTLDTNNTLAGRESAPASPSTTFPMKSSAAMSPSQFPRSPHAPPEEHEMPYLEKAAIESTAENKVCLSGGVIARSPLPIEINVTKASPEQHKEQDEEETPLNGTYGTMSTDTTVSGKRHSTFGSQTPSPLENSYASPALEATEENIVSDELEPMDVDVSMRIETTLLAGKESKEPSSPSPQECPGKIPSPSLPAQQQQNTEQLHHPKPLRASPPLPTGQLKRPSIHKDASALQPTCPNATVVLEEQQTLSAKEQLSVSDEKDVYVDHFGAMSPITYDIFKPPQYTSSTFNSMAKRNTIGAANAALAAAQEQFDNSEFQDGASNNNIILNSSDIDYLFTKGCSSAAIARSSLLLKFDPLLGTPVPENHHTQQEQALLNILGSNNNNNLIQRALSPTLEEHETSGGSNRSEEITQKHAKMSVDVIDNDCNKTFDNSNLNSEEKTHKYHNMDELEKKIKNEVTRSEDIENKLREAEQREEALVKRITEKDKNNAKLNSVIEAYEKAIAELIHDKEQLVQNHERQMAEVQADRDSNYTHLMSLETTFSDLHIKYEKSKEMTSHLRQIEETLLDEKKQIMDKLRQQEQRYEQMKSHAMQQMEIANRKLCTLSKEHTDEVKKLKALLKKEEVARIATTEQIQQKARENADLLKICEELIYDKGQSGTS